DSLLQFIRRLISRYRVSPEIGWGALRILDHDGVGVLAHEVSSDFGRMIAVHNFTEVPMRLRVEVGAVEQGTALLDLHGPGRIALDPNGRLDLELAPYGFRWLRVSPPGDTRIG
ncbi:MAG: trehalose synthase, partial [Microbacterium sp.]